MTAKRRLRTTSDGSPTRRRIKPHPGGQTDFLSTSADIAIFGGVAGPGKTFGILIECSRHIDRPGWTPVVFRRTYSQIRQEGGLWDQSVKIYSNVGSPKESTLEWQFPSGSTIRFAHMENEIDRYQWDGAEIPLICFDQLESFTEKQFWYLIGRNRSTCGVRPYVRATINPNARHFMRRVLDWWIDSGTGLAIPERSGKIRWFVRILDELVWADTPGELIERFGVEQRPMSFTFILGKLDENTTLLDQDKDYKSKLAMLQFVDRARLRDGNWNIVETAGTFFKREWFPIIPAAPQGRYIRYWDRAGTDAKTAAERGSHTSGALIGETPTRQYPIAHIARFQKSPYGVEEAIKNIASQDGRLVQIGIEQDPAQAGKAEALYHVRNLAGYRVVLNRVHESKGTRAKMLSCQAEAGNVPIVAGPWNEALLNELENFDGTDKCMSDQVDSLSGGFHLLTSAVRVGAWGK